MSNITVATHVISSNKKSLDKIERMSIPASDIKVVKVETFDIDVMESLASHDGISITVKQLLKSYKKNRQNGNMVQIIYEYGKSMKQICKGRLYPQKGLGLQNFPHDVRNALAGKYYWDVDMVNSQPVILYNLCKKNGWKCDKLKEYVENRSEHLDNIMMELKCDRDTAKTLCISVMFGARPINCPSFVSELADELSGIGKNIILANSDIMKLCEKERNPSASCVAHVCQDIEFNILRTIDSLLKNKGRSMDVYIHDGGLVLKEIGELVFPKNILDELENEIFDIFGYKIALLVKPMTHSFQFKNDLVRIGNIESGCVTEKEYQERKDMFEDNHFYCFETETICTIMQNGELLHVGRAFSAVFASFNFQKHVGRKVSTFDFISEWLRDPQKRTIQKLVFYPNIDHNFGDDSYNMFKGFTGMTYDGESEIESDKIVERFKCILDQNAGKNPIVSDYMLKWYALAIQKPEKIPGVALILINKIQGTGKDTLSEFFGSKVIGNQYYKNIKNVETELFDTHSTAFDKTTFMKLEEVNGSLNRKFSDMLKSMITTPNATINPKGLKKYVTDAFPHIVMTTNNAVPVKVEPSDRRFCISYTSSDYVGDTAFWTETYRLFALPGAGSAVYKYLNSINLKDFIVQDFPKTAYHEQLSTSEIPSEEQFMTNIPAFESKTSNELFNDYTTFCTENYLVPKSIIHFGRSLAPLIEQGILKKRRGRTVSTLYCKAL